MNFFADHQIPLCGSCPNHIDSIQNVPIYYGVQYNHSGKLRLRIDGKKEYQVEGSYAFITSPQYFFEYGSVNNEPRHHTFICSCGERVKQYVRTGLLPVNPASPLIPIGNPERFLQTMLNIIALTRRSLETPPRAVLMYEDLLLQLHEERNRRKTPPFQSPFLNELVESMIRDPAAEYDWEREADSIHVTPTHFRRIFKGFTGLPPQQYLIQCRLQRAADLLIHTLDPVGSIAENVGIGSEFYFSRLFRRKYRVSPMEYRREYNGD